MPIVTTDILALTLAGLKTNFMEAYAQVQETAAWKNVATEIPTTLPSQVYAWLGRGAVMEETFDEAREQELSQYSYTVADKEFKARMKIARTALEDDQYGALMMRVRALGAEPTRHWNELAFSKIADGFTNTCYDAQYFFDSDHSEGVSGTQSNVTSSPLSDAALQAGEAAMMAFVDDKGKPLEIMPDTLLVGPANARKAGDLTGSEVIVKNVGDGTAGSGATAYTPYHNYFKGRYRVVVTPYFVGTSAYYWALLDTSKPVKPIFIQSRSDVPITMESDMAEMNAHLRGSYLFQARGRYNAAYGLWQTGYGSNASS